jgi:glycosyltransferase involved in cell wall biosynthesis
MRTKASVEGVKKEITVIICTHNQADYLEKSLMSIDSQTLPKERFEIIVVDNASQDHVQEILQNFSSMRNLRYIYEPNLGLSFARNKGWQNAHGDYVAFMDCDAVACPDWLERITERFTSIHPKPAAVGGRIIPIWEGKRPDWLINDLETYVGIINWTHKPVVIDEENQYYLAGSNIAYQRDVLQKTGGFSVHLGRQGQRLLSNEEIFLQKKLMFMNMSLFYDPDICVRHHVKRQCLRKTWFYKRLFWQGISDVIMEYHISSMTDQTWSFFRRFFGDFSNLFSAALGHFKKVLERSIGRVSSASRILYWLGRVLYIGRILVGRKIPSLSESRKNHEPR